MCAAFSLARLQVVRAVAANRQGMHRSACNETRQTVHREVSKFRTRPVIDVVFLDPAQLATDFIRVYSKWFAKL